MLRVRRFMIGSLVALSISAQASRAEEASQTYSIYGTQVRKFHSEKVGIDYLLYVSLPRDYATSKGSYPVVYVMDADYCFPIVQTISRILEDHDEVRPLITVGVAYQGVAAEKYGPIFKSNRTRDYTPTRVAYGGYGPEIQKHSGGADRFLDFLEAELTPYVQSNFRAMNDRAIVGYSFSGLLACYAMIKRPTLFHRYLIVSPFGTTTH